MVDGKNVVSFFNTLFAHVTCFGPFGLLDVIEGSLSDQGLGVFCTLSSILLNLFLPGHFFGLNMLPLLQDLKIRACLVPNRTLLFMYMY